MILNSLLLFFLPYLGTRTESLKLEHLSGIQIIIVLYPFPVHLNIIIKLLKMNWDL